MHDLDDEQHIVAVLFNTPTGAEEAFIGLLDVQASGGIHFADAVAVAKAPNGGTVIRQTHDLTPVRGAFDGAWLGALVGLVLGGPVGGALAGAAGGALYAKLVDHGLDGTVVTTTFPDYVRRAIEDTLGQP